MKIILADSTTLYIVDKPLNSVHDHVLFQQVFKFSFSGLSTALTTRVGFTGAIHTKIACMYFILQATSWKFLKSTSTINSQPTLQLLLIRFLIFSKEASTSHKWQEWQEAQKNPIHRSSARLGEQGRCTVLGQRWSVSVSLPVPVLCWTPCPGI